MKKIVLLLALVFLYNISAEAKYVYPKGATTTTERRVNRRFKNYDLDGEAGLSLAEYKKFRAVRTVDDRQRERKAKHDGTYVSSDEAFKLMDKDEDGIISKEEMLAYEKEQIAKQQKKK